MVEYKCFRCEYTTSELRAFKNHLNRKNICKVTLDDVSINDIKQFYNLEIETKNKSHNKTSLDTSNIKLSTESGLSDILLLIEKQNEIINQQNEEINNIKCEIEELKQYKDNNINSTTTNTNNTNNTNNCNNTTNNITINNFGGKFLTHLDAIELANLVTDEDKKESLSTLLSLIMNNKAKMLNGPEVPINLDEFEALKNTICARFGPGCNSNSNSNSNSDCDSDFDESHSNIICSDSD